MDIWRITVVSPFDVSAEKETVSGVILELNRRFESSETAVQLKLYEFSTDVPAGLHRDGPQGLADMYLPFESCEYVIGIFWKRFGTPTLGAMSGTEHELRTARDLFGKSGKPDVLLYFKEEPFWPNTVEEVDQIRQVMELRNEFSQSSRYQVFRDIQTFKELLSGDLSRKVQNKLRASSTSTSANISSVTIKSSVLRASGITELISELEIKITIPSSGVEATAKAVYSLGIAFNTNFTGQL